MLGPETRACPRCGSENTVSFPDGSGACRNCGYAFRGSTTIGAERMGEEVNGARRVAKVRERDRLGLLGIVGSILGYLGVPGLFLLGAALSGRSSSNYVAEVINTPGGAITCGGLSFLVVATTYALWAGSLVWRGFPENSFHLLLAGLLCTGAAAIAGPGAQGIVGIAGGVLVLVAGFLVWLRTKAETDGPAEESAPKSEIA